MSDRLTTLSMAVVLLVATACASVPARAPAALPQIVGDTSPIMADLESDAGRLDSLFADIAAPLESGFGVAERGTLTAAVRAFRRGRANYPWTDSVATTYVVRTSGRTFALGVLARVAPPGVLMRFVTSDAAMAAHVRRVVREDVIRHTTPIGAVSFQAREIADTGGAPQVWLFIRTVQEYGYVGFDIDFDVDRSGEWPVVRLNGIGQSRGASVAAAGPQQAHIPIPLVMGRSRFDIAVREDVSRFIIDVTDSTRRVQRESGTSATADERPWWRLPPTFVGLACEDAPRRDQACRDVLAWIGRLPGARTVRAPVGTVDPLADYRLRSVVALARASDLDRVRACLAAVAPSLGRLAGFSLVAWTARRDVLEELVRVRSNGRETAAPTRVMGAAACG